MGGSRTYLQSRSSRHSGMMDPKCPTPPPNGRQPGPGSSRWSFTGHISFVPTTGARVPGAGAGREHMPWGSHTPVLGGPTRCKPSPGGLAVHRCSRLGTHASELEVSAESGADFRRFGSEVYQAERSQGSVRIPDVHPRGLGRALRVPGRTAAAPLHIEAARSPPRPSEGCRPGLSLLGPLGRPGNPPGGRSRGRSGAPAGRRLPAEPAASRAAS